MKILFINHCLVGGATSSLRLLMRGLKERGHEIHLIVPTRDNDRMCQILAQECVNLDFIDCGQFHSNQYLHSPLQKVVRETAKYFRNRARLRDYIQAHGIEMLHLNSTVLAHLLPYLASETDVRLCMHVRELLAPRYDPYGIGRYLIRTIRRHAHQIFCISENEAEAFSGQPNLAVIYNSFDFAELEGVPPAPVGGKPLVMMMGQFMRAKGQIEFLSAVRQLRESHPDIAQACAFRLVGIPVKKKESWRARWRRWAGDTYYEDFCRLRDEWQLQQVVELSPYVIDVWPQLQQATLLVRASMSGDPWGRDIIEAMAFGKAIVATGSYDRFARPGENAILVPPGDAQALADAIAQVMGTPGHVVEYGARSVALAHELFNYQANAAKVDAAYATIRRA